MSPNTFWAQNSDRMDEPSDSSIDSGIDVPNFRNENANATTIDLITPPATERPPTRRGMVLRSMAQQATNDEPGPSNRCDRTVNHETTPNRSSRNDESLEVDQNAANLPPISAIPPNIADNDNTPRSSRGYYYQYNPRTSVWQRRTFNQRRNPLDQRNISRPMTQITRPTHQRSNVQVRRNRTPRNTIAEDSRPVNNAQQQSNDNAPMVAVISRATFEIDDSYLYTEEELRHREVIERFANVRTEICPTIVNTRFYGNGQIICATCHCSHNADEISRRRVQWRRK